MHATSRILTAILLLILMLAVSAGCAREAQSRFAGRLEEADQVFSSRKYAEASVLFEEIADEAEAAGDRTAYAEAASMIARVHLTLGDRHGGEEWLERALTHTSQDDPLGWSRYLAVRGRFEWTAKELETARSTFVELYDFCEANGLYERAVDATHMIAIVAPPEERFEWSRKGIAMAEAGDLRGWLGPLWNNMGWDYLDAGEYDQALEALQNAREYHYESGQDLSKLIADYSVAHVKRLMGNSAEAKVEMQAVFDLANQMRASGNPDALEWVGFSRWELAELAVAEGSDGAVELMTQALADLKAAGMPRWDPDDWQKKQWRLEEVSGQ